jgi:hypothetical protein
MLGMLGMLFTGTKFSNLSYLLNAKSIRAGLKVEPPASNLGIYNQAIEMTVNNHHALSGGLNQCNYTNVSTQKVVQGLRTSL